MFAATDQLAQTAGTNRGGGERRPCGSSRPTPTPARSSVTSKRSRTRSACSGGTATRLAGIFAQIEVTALIGVADDAGPDDIVHEAEASMAAGVQAIVIRATGSEPSRWLEETWGPVRAQAGSTWAEAAVGLLGHGSSVILQSRAASSSGRAGDF